MNRKQRLTLLAALILLFCGYGIFSYHWLWGRGGELSLKPGVEVSRLVMDGPTGKVVIERDATYGWLVNGQHAGDVSAINNLITTLRRLEARNLVSVLLQEEVLASLEREGTTVSVYAGRRWLPWARRINMLIVGEDTPGGDATYVADRRREVYEVHLPGREVGLSASFSPRAHLWKSPLVVHLEAGEIRKVSVCHQDKPEDCFVLGCDAANGYTLYNRAGDSLEAEMIDRERTDRFLASFTGLVYERLLPGSRDHPPDDLLSTLPFLTIKVTDRGGDEYELQFFRRKRPEDGSLQSPHRPYDVNRFYLRVGHGDYALAQYYVFQWIMRSPGYFGASGQPSKVPS